MGEYRLCDGVRLQKNAKIAKSESVLEGVLSGIAEGGFKASGAFLSLALGGRFHILNLSASLILEGLLAGATDSELADTLAQVFDVDLERAEEDTRRIRLELISKGFIESYSQQSISQ
jgi:hypothetical protein